jgi:hypothetical protein
MIGRAAKWCVASDSIWFSFIVVFALAHSWLLFSNTLPPLHDYPGHLARIHIMSELGASEFLARYYEYDWKFRHNIGTDLLIYLLARVMPIEVAGRAVVALIPALNILGLAWLRFKVHGRLDSLVLLGVPYAMAVWLGWGFINYCFSIGLALFALAAWLDIRHWPPVSRSGALLAMGLIVWLFHLSGWAILCILIASWELTSAWEQRGRSSGLIYDLWWRAWRIAPLAAPMILIALSAGGGGQAVHFSTLSEKLWAPLWSLAFTWDRADKYCVVLLVLLASSALVFRLVNVSAALAVAALLILAAFAVSPTEAIGGGSVDVRLLTPLAMVASAALSWRVAAASTQWRQALIVTLTMGVAFVSIGRFTYSAIAVRQYDDEFSRSLALIEPMPKGARVLGLVVEPLRGGRPSLTHFPAMAVVRRDAYYNRQWVEKDGHTLRLKYAHTSHPGGGNIVARDAEGRSTGQLEAHLTDETLKWFDFVWIVNSHLAVPPQDPRLTLAGKTERMALYRVAHGTKAGAGGRQ